MAVSVEIACLDYRSFTMDPSDFLDVLLVIFFPVGGQRGRLLPGMPWQLRRHLVLHSGREQIMDPERA
jgi:hypothetical protein